MLAYAAIQSAPTLVRLHDIDKGFLGLGALSADGTLRAERLLATQSGD